LRAIAKSIFGILQGVTPDLVTTWRTEIFWGPQKSIIHPASPRGCIPKTLQAKYPNGLIKVLILI